MPESTHTLLHLAVSQVLDELLPLVDLAFDTHEIQFPERLLQVAVTLELNEDRVLEAVAIAPDIVAFAEDEQDEDCPF